MFTLVIEETTAQPEIGLTSLNVRKQVIDNPDTALQAFQNALLYWAKRGHTELAKKNSHKFTCVIAKDAYWVTVELKQD